MHHMDQLRQTLDWKMSHNGPLSSFRMHLCTCYHILTETCANKLAQQTYDPPDPGWFVPLIVPEDALLLLKSRLMPALRTRKYRQTESTGSRKSCMPLACTKSKRVPMRPTTLSPERTLVSTSGEDARQRHSRTLWRLMLGRSHCKNSKN